MSPRLRHYRPSSKPLATAWARHLDAQMRERDLSQTNVFDLVREELGYAPTSRSAFLRVFSDKVPDARLAAVLERHFGAPAPTTEPEPAEQSLQLRAVLAAERTAAAAERQATATEQMLTLLAAWMPQEARVDALATMAAQFAEQAGTLLPRLGGDPSSAPAR